MLAVILLLTALTVALFALTLMQLRPGRGAVTARLQQMQTGSDLNDTPARRRRQAKSERLKNVLQVLGQRVQGGRKDSSVVRQFLTQAGYPDASAVSVYWASRVTLAGGLPAAGIVLLPMLGASATQVILGILWFGALGWVGPTFYVRGRLKARQKEVQLALPDMLDMLVCCVEAGLGLNQALVRVSDEIDHVSPIMSEQLAMINLEMRAGTPRDEALKNFAERTGLVDIRSLVSMLIQTDRFGTSVATALRVHSETMRTKRRQRAEEAAAKTTIKLVFPLVLFVFPAMFVVVLGPSALAIFRTFSKL
ncbi:MAG TPA: type II secretion system F family protein [Gemmatimonadales bacterium]|nr:type II secretion system F family protein [Gemmatimonadales bacterium]